MGCGSGAEDGFTMFTCLDFCSALASVAASFSESRAFWRSTSNAACATIIRVVVVVVAAVTLEERKMFVVETLITCTHSTYRACISK